MMKVLANDGMAVDGVDALQAAGFEVSTNKVEQDKLIEHINQENVEVLLVRSATKVRKDMIDACSGLKMIGRGGVGMDNIDVEYARSKGIQVVNTPAASSQSVAELVMAHLFTLVRSLHDSNRMMPDNGSSDFAVLKKKYAKGIELRGKTLGIIGFGRIGQSVASYALGIGMKVVAYDAIDMTAQIELGIEGAGLVKVEIKTKSMDEVLRESDFITLHIPAQKDGAAIGKEQLSKMKDGVILINAARGGVVDEDALLSALDSGKVKAAGLDVFINEPTPSGNVLKHAGVSLSPHIGAATGEAQNRISIELADQIISAFGKS